VAILRTPAAAAAAADVGQLLCKPAPCQDILLLLLLLVMLPAAAAWGAED
jgi:hypothetical protein